jgi:hypothetical protein
VHLVDVADRNFGWRALLDPTVDPPVFPSFDPSGFLTTDTTDPTPQSLCPCRPILIMTLSFKEITRSIRLSSLTVRRVSGCGVLLACQPPKKSCTRSSEHPDTVEMGCIQSLKDVKVDPQGNCRVWTGLEHPDFLYPELSGDCPELVQKLNYGIALSGGGCRALTYAIGTLRGLHLLNLLHNARYVSTNSGSSWLSGPAAHLHEDTNLADFLGQYIPPDQCTMKKLKEVDERSHAFFLSEGSNLDTLFKELRESLLHRDGDDPRDFWSQAIGNIFFKKYHLNQYDCLPVLAGPNEEVIAAETGFPREKMTSYNASRYPFPIINGSVVVRGRQVSAPLEFTPLYYGIPDNFVYKDERLTFPVGGYLIEPFGFTSNPTANQRTSIKSLLATTESAAATTAVPPSAEGEGVEEGVFSPVAGSVPHHVSTNAAASTILPPSVVKVNIPKPKTVIGISEQAGISSSAIAQATAKSVTTEQGKRFGMTVRPLWNPLSGETHDMILADGFGADNTAVHSLLRRKVQKICTMFAIDLSILEEVNHRSIDESGFADIAALFGVMTCKETTVSGILPADYNKYRQVFPSEDYESLVNGLRERCRQGKPCTYLLHTRALPNSLVGIPGGHPVDLLMICCDPSASFMNALPEATRHKVTHKEEDEEDDDKSKGVLGHLDKFFDDIGDNLEDTTNTLRQFFKRVDLREFPFPRTECMDYSPRLVNLMTNLMTWQVLESKDLFDELLKSD